MDAANERKRQEREARKKTNLDVQSKSFDHACIQTTGFPRCGRCFIFGFAGGRPLQSQSFVRVLESAGLDDGIRSDEKGGDRRRLGLAGRAAPLRTSAFVSGAIYTGMLPWRTRHRRTEDDAAGTKALISEEEQTLESVFNPDRSQ